MLSLKTVTRDRDMLQAFTYLDTGSDSNKLRAEIISYILSSNINSRTIHTLRFNVLSILRSVAARDKERRRRLLWLH